MMDASFYRTLIEESPVGYCLFRIVTNAAGQPIDLQYEDMNRAFEALTGVRPTDSIGRLASQVLREFGDIRQRLIRLAGEVALTGGRREFESTAVHSQRMLRVLLHSPLTGFCVARLTDITLEKSVRLIQQRGAGLACLNAVSRLVNRTDMTRAQIGAGVAFHLNEAFTRSVVATAVTRLEIDGYPYAAGGPADLPPDESEQIPAGPETFTPGITEIQPASPESPAAGFPDVFPTAPETLAASLAEILPAGPEALADVPDYLPDTPEATPPAAAENQQISCPISVDGEPRGSIEVSLPLVSESGLKFGQGLVENVASVLSLWMKRKAAETRLRDEREMLRTTLASLGEGILVMDPDGRISLVNGAAERITGYARTELIGRLFAEALSISDSLLRQPAFDRARALVRNGPDLPEPEEFILVQKGGTEIRLSASFAPIHSEAGALQGIILSFRDISKVFELQREADAFLELNLDLICITALDGSFVRMNRRFEEILGYAPHELEGQNFLDFVHPENSRETRIMFESLHSCQSPEVLVNRFRCKNGVYKSIEWHSMPGVRGLIYSSGRDVTEKLLREEQLKVAAVRDELTGLYNRHYFETVIVNLMEQSDRYNVPLSMLILDLDHFKHVNDTWGHPIGDELLKLTAATVCNRVRESDIVFRFGGEEFIVLMSNTNLAGARVAAEKIRQAIRDAVHPVTGPRTASLGVAERMRYESFRHWYRRLDEALYLAKQEGRDRVVISDGNEQLPLTAFHLEWRNEWDSGNIALDKQHLMLLQMSNRLVYTSLQGAGDEELQNQLDQLLEAVANHFSDEEELLTRIGYKEREDHAAEHNHLLNKAKRLRQLYLLGEIKAAAYFSHIVDDIIIGHMNNTDTRFLSLTRSLSTTGAWPESG